MTDAERFAQELVDDGRVQHPMLCADELRRLSAVEAAYIEWQNKTEWVQQSIEPRELGKHRADVLRERIERLSAENESLRADAERYRWLMANPLWNVSYRVKRDKNGKDYREYRMRDEGEYWGQWWPTSEQAIDAARSKT